MLLSLHSSSFIPSARCCSYCHCVQLLCLL